MTPTIFVPLDGSERAEAALPVADRLAIDLDASLVCVTSTFTRDTTIEGSILKRGLTLAKSRRARIELLRGASTATAIVEAAARVPDGMICMSTHGRGAVATVLLGSVANEVVARSEVPVILVGPSYESSAGCSGDVLVCVSGRDEPARTIGVGARFARDLDVGLRVVNVVAPGRHLDRQNDDLGDRLGPILRRCGIDAREHDLVGSDPAKEILRLATTFDPRFVVLGRYVDPRRYGRPLGHVAHQLIQESRCPLVVVPAMMGQRPDRSSAADDVAPVRA